MILSVYKNKKEKVTNSLEFIIGITESLHIVENQQDFYISIEYFLLSGDRRPLDIINTYTNPPLELCTYEELELISKYRKDFLDNYTNIEATICKNSDITRRSCYFLVYHLK